MQDHKIGIVYTTISSLKDAKNLAYQAIELKLAACVNIMPKGLSIYLYDSKVHEEQEYFLLFKTKKTKAPALKKWLITNHPYSTPAILEMSVQTSMDFFNFVNHII